MIPNERSRPEGCATDLKLDAWFAGELSAGAVAELAAHVDACARCRTRRAALATEREAFFALQPRPRARAARAASRPGRVVVLGAVLAAAAAVALAVWPGGTQIEPTVR